MYVLWMRRIRGLKALLHDAVDLTVDLVREGFDSTSRTIRRVTDPIEPIAQPALATLELVKISSGTVLQTIKVVNRGVQIVSDAGIDLAHGLQRQRYFKTGLGDTLPAVVYGLSEGLRDEVISEDAPFIGVIGNDALSKQRFWTNAYRSIQTQSEQAIKAERVHALFEDPAYIENLLRVRIPH